MDFIDSLTGLVDDLDLASLVPDLSTVLGWVELIAKLFLLVPPILLVGFGLWYRFKPPKEANHFIGYRFYLGMGSVEAWQYTQRLAGILWVCLGGVLLLVNIIVALSIGGENVPSMVSTTLVWLIIEFILVAASCVFINTMVGLRYDKDGNLRPSKRTKRTR